MEHSKSDYSGKALQVGDLPWVASEVLIKFRHTKTDPLARGQEVILQRVAEG